MNVKKTPYLTMAVIAIVIIGISIPVINTPLDTPTLFTPTNLTDSAATNRTAPITITSNTDFPLHASSGSGTPANPWIIENKLIECNGSGSGIFITGTDDYCIIRDCEINETGGSPAASYNLQATANIAIEDCISYNASNVDIVIAAAKNVNVTRFIASNTTSTVLFMDNATNCNIHSVNQTTITGAFCDLNNVFTGIGNTNITFTNCTARGIINFNEANTITITNCTWLGNDALSVYATNLLDAQTVVFDNCTFDRVYRCVALEHSQNIIVRNCTFNSCTECLESSYGDNAHDVLFTGNLCIDSFSCAETFGLDNISITYNTFENCSWGPYILDMTNYDCRYNTFREMDICILTRDYASGSNNASIQYNWFESTNTAYHSNETTDTHTGNYTWERNYYQDYFDFSHYPNATSLNLTILELEYDYNISVDFTDEHPLYWGAWFTRTETVNVRFYSNVNGDGILFDHLQVKLDGVQVASPSLVPGDLLFRLTVLDYEGRNLYDEVHNLNDTSTNLNIGLDTTARVYFSFYSSLDYFGLDFGLVKLYIDNVRITTPSPEMRPREITVTVKDYANIAIYNASLNLSALGVYVDIALPIAPITVTNNYNRTVIFHLVRGTTTTDFAMGSGMQLSLRLALGDYTYIVRETNGTELAIADITFQASKPQEFIISFGWTSTTPEPITVYSASLLDYILMFAFLGAIIGVVLFVAFKLQGFSPSGSRSRPERKQKKGKGRKGQNSIVRVFSQW